MNYTYIMNTLMNYTYTYMNYTYIQILYIAFLKNWLSYFYKVVMCI